MVYPGVFMGAMKVFMKTGGGGVEVGCTGGAGVRE